MDVVVTLALIIALTAAILVTVRRVNGGFAGFGTVQSGSMTASGLNIGDVVRVEPRDKYSEGDIIVFYRAPESYKKPFDKINAGDYEIWIHEVIDMREDSLGRTCYLTKGSSNKTDDGAYVPQDFVLGKATKLNDALCSLFNFICSVRGIIVLVEVPCGIVLVYLVWDLVMTLTKAKDKKHGDGEEDKEEGKEEKGGVSDTEETAQEEQEAEETQEVSETEEERGKE